MLSALCGRGLNWTSCPFGVMVLVSLIGFGSAAEVVGGVSRHGVDRVGGYLIDTVGGKGDVVQDIGIVEDKGRQSPA